MLYDGKDWIELTPFLVFAPGRPVSLTVLSVNCIGDGLRDVLDPRLGNGLDMEMADTPCSQRIFPFRLAAWLPTLYASYLYRLRHLLERLGRDCALAVWQAAQPSQEDEFLHRILGSGWMAAAPGTALDVEESIAGLFREQFPLTLEGVSREQARQLVEALPPIGQIRRALPSMDAWRETTACEALHLRFCGLSGLVKALMRLHGKEGELIAYDMQREERIRAGGGRTGTVAEFITGFTSQPKEANLFTVGLTIEIVRVSQRELVMNVRECEWARYFRERDPEIGYLMACSTDEAACRAFNDRLRLQRRSTTIRIAIGLVDQIQVNVI